MSLAALIADFPPGLVLILGGLLLPLIPARVRLAPVLGFPLLALALVWQAPDGTALPYSFLGMEGALVRADALARLFGTVFGIMALVGGLYAVGQARTTELAAAFVYAGGAVGCAFAGDLMSLFAFWETMAIASTLVLWSAGTAGSYGAGLRYVLVHLLGGVVLMAGIAIHVLETGSADFTTIGLDGAGSWLILAGFLVNVAAPPFSAWLPDAYPEASPSGMVFLSAFTTKTAVYVLLRGFPGEEILIYVGLWMIFYGIVYALLDNDMRRILAYSIVSQVGFMVTGIGIGTEMALNGTAAHAFTHIIYKAALLMSAGSVLHMTGRRLTTELGGLYRTMPITTVCGIVGALSISAFPFTSGFISKSLITQSAAESQLAYVWYLLTAASAGTALYVGFRFPWLVFFGRSSGLRAADPSPTMNLATVIAAALCVGLGVAPGLLYRLLPYPVDYAAYTGDHLVTQLQLLLFAGLAFFVTLPMVRGTETITLDLDWFYRRLGKGLAMSIASRVQAIDLTARRAVLGQIDALIAQVFRHHGPQGVLARTWPTGSTVLWVAVLLAGFLLLYFAQ